MRAMPNGDHVANFSIACGWKTKTKEGTEWINIVAFGKLAEIIGQYLKKGSRIYISGGMRTRKWQDQSGTDRYSVEIIANDMIMLDSKGSENSKHVQNSAPERSTPNNDFDDFSDPIPF